MLRRWVAGLSFLLILSGCVISPRRSVNNNGGGGGNGTGQIYVSNESNNSITRFSGATAATGNISPAATISGANTQLNQPQYIFVDTTNNRLYVANLGAADILVFDNLSTLNGDVRPTRVISNSTSLVSPIDVALDATNNLLYVADKSSSGGAILVFASASAANGTTTPARTILPGFIPGAILLDSANDRLFVTDPVHDAVDIYDKASTLNSTVTASRSISGANTQLSQPFGLRIDGAGRLIVSNSSPPSISIYTNAASTNGNINPVTVISGSSTTLTSPTELALDPTTNSGELYVADPVGQEVVVFSNISTATGTIDAKPNRQIIGSKTTFAISGASTSIGIALDTTR
jgi:6-phosphogluconolactonase (cycloisomerase 2 family)